MGGELARLQGGAIVAAVASPGIFDFDGLGELLLADVSCDGFP